MPFVFNYSAISSKDFQATLGAAPFCSLPAVAVNYFLDFRGQSRKWGSSLATLIKRKGFSVYGSVDLVSLKELELVDKLYGPHYQREKITVETPVTGDTFSVWTYLVTASSQYPPSTDYLNIIAKNLKFFWSGKLKPESLYNKEESAKLVEASKPLEAPVPSVKIEEVAALPPKVETPKPVAEEPPPRKRGRPRKDSKK